jgi:hypothetical protein
MDQWPYCILDKGQASYNPKQKRSLMIQSQPLHPHAEIAPTELKRGRDLWA